MLFLFLTIFIKRIEMRTFCFIAFMSILHFGMAQQPSTTELPYREIPPAAENYGPGNILSRMIDGLGYRYYWATEGLRENDLLFSPSKEARTTRETLEHICGLSETVVNATTNTSNIRPADWSELSFEALREKTLSNLQQASANCSGKSAEDISKFTIRFAFGERTSEFPYWNMINGPISDAIYHVGQVVSFRRSSGNPIHPGVNVFQGKTRE